MASSGYLYFEPRSRPSASNWGPLPGATLTFYITATTTPTQIYSDIGLVTPLPNPVEADSTGLFPTIYLDGSVTYRVILKDQNSVTLEDTDPGAAQAVVTLQPYPQPQTPAEILANIVPAILIYTESDIRRYGASISLADNALAINSALAVSSAGGSAVFIPAGTWNTATPLAALAGSSMYGVGMASSIVCANGIDGLQFTASDSGITPTPRFFRDFSISGTLSGTTNSAHAIYINASSVDQVLFSNLAIANFEWAVWAQGLYYSTFFNCWAINCYHGVFFNNQSVNVWITNCTWQHVSSGVLITGVGNSTGISVQGAPEVEGLHVQGGSIYGFDYNFNFGLIFECQIEAVDISFAKVCPIYFSSTLGPMVIRDCWIELGSGATGTWNAGAPGNLTGIFIAAITPAPSVSKVLIVGNEIVSDVTLSGSTALYLGNSNAGLVVEDNQIRGFDIGIGGGNTIINPGGLLVAASIKKNTISAGTSTMLFNSSSTEMVLGPNYIVSGALPAFNASVPADIIYTQPNVPMQGTVTFPASSLVGVTFANPMPWTSYHVSLSGNAAGYCWISSKTTGGFTVNCSSSNSNSVDWSIS